jgi:hypothetical protein
MLIPMSIPAVTASATAPMVNSIHGTFSLNYLNWASADRWADDAR